MNIANSIALRFILILGGVFAVYSGLDQALGGLFTLGWMGQQVFFEIADQHLFLVADNHHRFLGGVWTGIGLFFFLAITNLEKYQIGLYFAFSSIFIGGLARFSQMNFDIIFGPEVVGALLVEIIGMPLLFLWLLRSVRQAE